VTNRVYVMIFLVVVGLSALAQAQTFTTLYNFTGSTDGNVPFAGVIQDSAGNLYGTTNNGGNLNCFAPFGCGVVFAMNTAGAETVLYTFSGADGDEQNGPLARDSQGNLYGTSWVAGDNGYGNVFKIDSAGNETVLYSFTGGSDGCVPMQGLVLDASGTLFGTTEACGSSSDGTIFKIDGTGRFTVLHSFTGSPSDGAWPQNGYLSIDEAGNLYGVTASGGAHNKGALYKLGENGTLTLVHSFAGGTSDGCLPLGTVRQDKSGNLYGTTFQCGSDHLGTIWKLSAKGKETILHNFAGRSRDGCGPQTGLVGDSSGNLYGVTLECGAHNYGTLYELSAKGKLTLLHSFDDSDGAYPVGEVMQTAQGTLFGTTLSGGTYYDGTVWSYVP